MRIARDTAAVSDIGVTTITLEKIFDSLVSVPRDVVKQGVRSTFLNFGETEIGLVECVTEHSLTMPLLTNPIRACIARLGQRLHHICSSTEDLDGQIKRLSRNRAHTLLSGVSRNANGQRVVFLNLGRPANLLIEHAEDAP
jgi:hypothetical protein